MICSYCGENKELERQYLSGELEIEFVPQVMKMNHYILIEKGNFG